jgi:hypothetical protein
MESVIQQCDGTARTAGATRTTTTTSLPSSSSSSSSDNDDDGYDFFGTVGHPNSNNNTENDDYDTNDDTNDHPENDFTQQDDGGTMTRPRAIMMMNEPSSQPAIGTACRDEMNHDNDDDTVTTVNVRGESMIQPSSIVRTDPTVTKNTHDRSCPTRSMTTDNDRNCPGCNKSRSRRYKSTPILDGVIACLSGMSSTSEKERFHAIIVELGGK